MRILACLISLSILLLTGCDSYDPDRSTATSGRLILMVDEIYEPLIRDLADSFRVRTPSTKISIEVVSARTGVQELINRHLADTSTTDTATVVAMILGRELLGDERQVIAERRLDKNLVEIPIAYDGIAVVVPIASSLQQTTVERLRTVLSEEGGTLQSLQDEAGETKVSFVFPEPNSSTYSYVRSVLLSNAEPKASIGHRRTSDSVLNAVAAGEGISIMSWYRAHRDSARVRTLQLGFTDSTGLIHEPVRVHPSSLAMELYPLKQRIVGYTFARVNSPANGFLTWLAKSAQQELVNRGLDGENVRYQFEAE